MYHLFCFYITKIFFGTFNLHKKLYIEVKFFCESWTIQKKISVRYESDRCYMPLRLDFEFFFKTAHLSYFYITNIFFWNLQSPQKIIYRGEIFLWKMNDQKKMSVR